MASLPQVQQYISTRYYDSSDKSTDVHVTGISDKALSGIVHAMQVHQAILKNVEASISNTNQQTSDLTAEIVKNNKAKKQFDEHTRVDQIGQQRVHRAEQAVLTGQINDVLSGIDALKNMFKSMFDSLKNLLKDNFKRVMKAYDEFSATMRKRNISTEEKNLAHLLADRAFLKTSDLGLNASKDQIREALMGMVNIGDFKKLSDTQLALAAQMKVSTGLDEKTILHIIRSSNNEDELKEIVLRMTDRFSAESQGKVYEEIFKKHGIAANQVMLEQYGGSYSAMVKDVQNLTREFTRLTSSSLSSEEIAELVSTSFLAQHGQIQELDNKLVSDMLMAAGQSGLDGGQSLIEFFKNNLSTIRNPGEIEKINAQLLALSKSDKISDNLARSLSNLFVQVNNRGLDALTPDKLASDDELRETNRVNKQQGQFFDYVDRAISQVNVATKGMLSSTSTWLDEMFGGSLNTGDIVTDGFANVLSVLKSIRFSLMAGSIFKLVKGAGSGIALGFNKLKSLFSSKIPALAGGKAAITAATEVAAKDGASVIAKSAVKSGAASGVKVVESAAANSIKAVENAVSNTGKTLGKALQTGSKVLSKAALPLAVAVEGVTGIYEAHSALNTEIESTAEKTNTQNYKNFEKQQNQQIKNNRAAAALVKSSLAVGGTIAGAKLGAAVGTALGPVGTIVGGVVGAGVGLAGGLVSDAIFSRREINLENEKFRAKLTDLQIQEFQLQQALDQAKRENDPVTAQKLEDMLKGVKSDISNAISGKSQKTLDTWHTVVDPEGKMSGAMTALSKDITATENLRKNQLAEMQNLATQLSKAKEGSAERKALGIRYHQLQEEAKKSNDTLAQLYKARVYATSHQGEHFEEGMSGIDYLTAISGDSSFSNWTNAHNSGNLSNVSYAQVMAKHLADFIYEGVGDKVKKELEGGNLDSVLEVIDNLVKENHLNDYEATVFRHEILKEIKDTNPFITDEVMKESKNQVEDQFTKSTDAFNDFNTELESATKIMREAFGSLEPLSKETSSVVNPIIGTINQIAQMNNSNSKSDRKPLLRSYSNNPTPNTYSGTNQQTNNSYAIGGIINGPTRALIGEDGKEAVLPLTKPDMLKRVLNALTREERLNIANSILSRENDLLSYSSLSSVDSSTNYDYYAESNLKERFRQVLNEAGLSDKISEFNTLYNEAVRSIVASVSAESAQYARQYAKHALSMIGSGNKDQIVAALKEIISYLSGIAKNNTVSRAPAQRLPNNVFGR